MYFINNKKNKSNFRAFTLIELLAVMVVLAIIALITIPILFNVIGNARKKASEDSMYGYVKAVETAYVIKEMEGASYYAGKVYTSLTNKNIAIGDTVLPISVSGMEPSQSAANSLSLSMTGKVDSAKIKFGTCFVYYDGNKATCEKSEDDDLEESSTLYTDPILHGADPVLKEDMIPVLLDSSGNVQYASSYTKWYDYSSKKWANAVILVENPSQQYKKGDIIKESDIQSYFVWIPRFKYKLWDMGNYTSFYSLSDLTDGTAKATSVYHMTGKARLIDLVFENKQTSASKGNSVGSYLTHPAFTNFDVNGFWIGKFETGYNQSADTKGPISTTSFTTAGAERDELDGSKLIIKPNVYTWRNILIYHMFMSSYQYRRKLDSHMAKNTEWGAAAYLSYSVYGIGSKVNLNNNSSYLTGYSSASGVEQSTYKGITGTSSSVTQGYNTLDGAFASTTGNITGVYDMAGGANEYVAAYVDGYGVQSSASTASGFSSEELITYAKYLDKYPNNGTGSTYYNRILGDATGELGPFYSYYEKDDYKSSHNSWDSSRSHMTSPAYPWPLRGGNTYVGSLGGQFYFTSHNAPKSPALGFRVVLTVK